MFASLLRRVWWILLVQGILAIVFGVAAIAWPLRSLTAIIGLFGVLSLVGGVVSIVRAFSPPGAGAIVMVVQGIAGIIAGLVALLSPVMTAIALVYVIAAWIISQSILQFVLAFQVSIGRILLIIAGIVGLVSGLWMAGSPGEGALAISWLIGISTVIWGATMVAAGWQLRGVARSLDDPGSPAIA
jgi:uncharacterized membrane protein HdeD (DUF308 family)